MKHKKMELWIKNSVQILGILFILFGIVNMLDDVLGIMPNEVKGLLLILLGIMFITFPGDKK